MQRCFLSCDHIVLIQLVIKGFLNFSLLLDYQIGLNLHVCFVYRINDYDCQDSHDYDSDDDDDEDWDGYVRRRRIMWEISIPHVEHF